MKSLSISDTTKYFLMKLKAVPIFFIDIPASLQTITADIGDLTLSESRLNFNYLLQKGK